MDPLKRVGALALALSLTTGGAIAHSETPQDRAHLAVHYLTTQQADDGSLSAFSPVGTTADAVVSMVGARRDQAAIDDALDFIAAHADDASSVGLKAKVVMAAVAGKRDPRDFGGHDFVTEIESAQGTGGHYGDTVMDHVLAILALVSAGRNVPANAEQWLVDAQCPDGGWQYDTPPRNTEDAHCFDGTQEFDEPSNTNTTGYAVQAWHALGADLPLAHDPFDFFKASRDPVKHGWIYNPTARCKPDSDRTTCFVTDAYSTALVIQAYAASDRQVPEKGRHALERLQPKLCGGDAGAVSYSWSYQDGQYKRSDPDAGATIVAIPGFLLMPFPIPPLKVTKPAPNPGRC
jgi:hypothetical protein